MALLDPPRWGWPALGAVTDLLTPHEVRALLTAFTGRCHRVLLCLTQLVLSSNFTAHSALDERKANEPV